MCSYISSFKGHYYIGLQSRRTILVAFSKIAKATVSFVMFVRLSVRMEQLGSHWTDFHEIWYLRIFRKSIDKIQVPLKSDKTKGYFTWSTIHAFLWYLTRFFLEWEMVQARAVETTKTHMLWLNKDRPTWCHLLYFFII